jgi:hypothetical protein
MPVLQIVLQIKESYWYSLTAAFLHCWGGQVREWLNARPHDFSTSVINMASILTKIESKQLHYTWYMLTMPLMFVM